MGNVLQQRDLALQHLRLRSQTDSYLTFKPCDGLRDVLTNDRNAPIDGRDIRNSLASGVGHACHEVPVHPTQARRLN